MSFNVLAIDVPAALADNSRYANTCTSVTTTVTTHKERIEELIDRKLWSMLLTWSWPKSNQTCNASGKSVAPLEISQTEAHISNREYRATIAFAATTNLNFNLFVR
jgi:hypothetical protein